MIPSDFDFEARTSYVGRCSGACTGLLVEMLRSRPLFPKGNVLARQEYVLRPVTISWENMLACWLGGGCSLLSVTSTAS